MTLTESDIGLFPLLFAHIKCSGDDKVSTSGSTLGSLLGDVDGDLRAIGARKPSLVFETFRHRAVADLMRVAEFVELEQFRRQRLAARMALTFNLIDAYFQLCRHGVVMSAEQGLLTGELAHTSREQLVEEIVEQTKLSLSLAIEAAGGEGG